MLLKWHMSMALRAGSLLFVAAPLFANSALASTESDQKHHSSKTVHHSAVVSHRPIHSVAHSDVKHTLSKTGKARYGGGGGIQCVTFARATSGIALKGNAANWWDAAAGVYERGSRPEVGSVLNFRANGHMRLGHVAVVTGVRSAREIEIDHANWSVGGYTKGNVSRGMKVIDVSDANDWSRVRVELGHTDQFGSIYPAYGFIYDRPDTGHMVANIAATHETGTPRPALGLDEVAEAPYVQTIPAALSVDAPDHSLR